MSQTNVTEVRGFLGLTGYYHPFIEGFSCIVAPLTCLTKKGVFFDWDPKCEESFVELKCRLATASALVLPDYTGQF